MTSTTTDQPADTFDVVGFVIAYESGETSMLEALEGFGHLIRTGQAWSLQGSYGRTARALIDGGLLAEDGNLTDLALDRLAEIPEEEA